MNRKLIRPSLTDVKPQERDQRNGGDVGAARRSNVPTAPMRTASNTVVASNHSGDSIDDQAGGAAAKTAARRNAPPLETNAKVYYYKKQIDSHTRMVVVLQDNEEIEGTIEWYDRGALKINRKTAPNIMLLEHNIKYMYKVEE